MQQLRAGMRKSRWALCLLYGNTTRLRVTLWLFSSPRGLPSPYESNLCPKKVGQAARGPKEPGFSDFYTCGQNCRCSNIANKKPKKSAGREWAEVECRDKSIKV